MERDRRYFDRPDELEPLNEGHGGCDGEMDLSFANRRRELELLHGSVISEHPLDRVGRRCARCNKPYPSSSTIIGDRDCRCSDTEG